MSDIYDVVVVGAGPGGSATAYYLARHGLNTLLLDKAEFPRDKTCGDGLTPRALAVLADMGVLDKLAQVGCRINGMEIYAPSGHSIGAPIPAGNDRPAYMLVVPRLALDNILREYALAGGAAFESHVHVSDVKSDGNGVVVQGERDGKPVVFTGRAAVIATGANSRLLARMGLLAGEPATMVAARAYYENLDVMNDRVQLRFDGVPFPGYAWIFPTGQRSANVGAGYFEKGKTRRRKRASPQDVFTSFAQNTRIKDALARAKRVSPLKGYPLRIDFTTSRTFGERVLLVGEVAGLVNPLSGEGVDYALESGKVAAEHLISMFEQGDFSRARFEAYDRELRERFQALFQFCERVRDMFFTSFAINILVSIAEHRKDLKLVLIRVVLGEQPVPRRFTYWRLLKALLTPHRRVAGHETAQS